MCYLYIVECKDKSFYVGISRNLAQRLRDHNAGKACKYTEYRHPVKLVYSEKYANISSAMKREKQIKGWNREKKMKLVRGKSLSNEKL